MPSYDLIEFGNLRALLTHENKNLIQVGKPLLDMLKSILTQRRHGSMSASEVMMFGRCTFYRHFVLRLGEF